VIPWYQRTLGGDLRIWDLRRGGDDDDRTNPHGRGLRSLVFSAALEFNYLKAPIGFLALFVALALLIGIAPLIAISYVHLVLHAPAWAGGSLSSSVDILPLLVSLGYNGSQSWMTGDLAAIYGKRLNLLPMVNGGSPDTRRSTGNEPRRYFPT
jgi:hypothetical protein